MRCFYTSGAEGEGGAAALFRAAGFPLRMGRLCALLLAFSLSARATPAQSVAFALPFTAGDGAATQTLTAGLDPSATAGLDPALGEEELPPFPPGGVFEVRFVSNESADLGQGSYRDYRPGSIDFEGAVEHRLRWQLGSGEAFRLGYDLPTGVTAQVQDPFGGVVLDEMLSGAGELVVENTALTEAILTISYSGNPVAHEPVAPSYPALAVRAAFPNPFATATRVAFDLPASAEVTAWLYDAAGREVRRYPLGRLDAGAGHAMELRAAGLSAGLYYLRIRATAGATVFTASRSLTLTR